MPDQTVFQNTYNARAGRVYTRKKVSDEPQQPKRKKASSYSKLSDRMPIPKPKRIHEVVDRNSGQVYLESFKEPSLASSKGAAWVHETPFLPEGWDKQPVARGAPSLMHAATRQALSDQRNLRPELFASVPWRLAKSLWDILGQW